MGYCAVAPVLGLIVPSEPVPVSVTQRLPSGPAVMLKPLAFAFGRANTLMASVVGLITPIWSTPDPVNQRLPSGPAVIPRAEDALGVARKLKASVVGLNCPT
jgi:hypothetical protein